MNYVNRPDYNRSEELKARKDGAKLVKNSGRGMNKGDAIYRDIYMVDYKFTEKASYSLNLAKFKELEKQATRQGMDPITVAVFECYNDKSIAMIDWDLLKEILDERSFIGEQ